MDKIKFQEILKFALDPIHEYLTKPRLRGNSYYLKQLRRRKVISSEVLLESYHAVNLTGNVYAIFTEMVKKYPNLKFIWIYSDKKDTMIDFINKEWPKAKIKFVKYESKKYYRYLASSKYLINDTSFMPYFVKRNEQIYINTWHGTPLKTLGMDIKNAKRSDHKNIQRNLLQVDKLLMPNQLTADKLIASHDLNGILPAKVFVTGNARVDLVFSDAKSIRKKYNLPREKIILYAPTWKKSIQETTVTDIEEILNEVNDLQKRVGSQYKVLLKSHYFVYDFFVSSGYGDKVVSNSVDTNELLSAVDILITDYSSIFFDFLPLHRPIYFYIPDKEAYKNSRGFYMDLEQLPGLVTEDLEKIENVLETDQQKYLKMYEEEYQSFLREYCSLDDGHARERSVNAIFEKNSRKTKELSYDSEKRKLVFYAGGFLNNGITNSVINLTNKIDLNKYEIIFIEYSKMNEARLANIDRLNKRIHFIFKFSYMNRTLRDTYNQNLVYRQGYGSKNVNQKEFKDLNRWELKRIIGNLQPDVLIDFGGYNKMYSALFSLSNVAKRKVIFLHNIMFNEYNKKINGVYKHRWNLKPIFSFYNQFDRIVSVSKSAWKQNKLDLSNWVKDPDNSMTYVENMIDGEKIEKTLSSIKDGDVLSENNTFDHKKRLVYDRALNSAGILIEESFIMPDTKFTNFVNVARLSPEKNHVNLIRAFYKLHEKYPNVKLHILGEGPSRQIIEDEIIGLGLSDSVLLYGFISNPVLFIHYCDCFILPSNYEGQGLSLVEAMIAKMPVIGTDVPGIKSVLQGTNGLMVNNSVDGIFAGMEKFLLGKIEPAKFDYHKYNQRAIHDFYERVVE